MRRPRRSNAVAYALFANAAIMLGILITLLGRGGPFSATPAMAEPTQSPIAGGGGVFVMPCQLHTNMWGCYLLDTERQTLCAYEYRTGDKSMVLTAARHFQYDLQLKNYDTFPAWYDVQKLVEDQNDHARRTDNKAAPNSSSTPAQ